MWNSTELKRCQLRSAALEFEVSLELSPVFATMIRHWPSSIEQSECILSGLLGASSSLSFGSFIVLSTAATTERALGSTESLRALSIVSS
jgi:hypothetical protein